MTKLDPQAILDGRTPGRPSLKLIVGMVITSTCALGTLALFAFLGQDGNFFVGLGLAMLPVPILLSAVLLLDRLEPEPVRDLVFAFLWGAGVAVVGALVLNTLGYRYVTAPFFGDDQGLFWTTTVGAPVIEESLKGAVLFVLLWFRRNEIDGVTDGIVYAAMVALGFAMMENISYYMQALDDGGAGKLEAVFILRGLISPFGHPLFTAMTGLGVAWAANHRRGRVPALVLGLVGAILLHALWNGAASYGLGGLAVVYVLDFGILVVLLVLIFLERRGLVHRIGRYLPVYVRTGLVSPQDIVMLGSIQRRRAARRWARSVGGRGAARAMSDYQLGATELVLLHKRLDAGVIDGDYFATRRNELLHLMAVARQALLIARPKPATPPWGPSGITGETPQPPPPGPPPRR
ncbi:PrsW family intramembrane metalloprotease [Actinocorallia sp. API 0066]|uniref:PrsW family intramembrane metalloprotease n=1 Tax=Actinocorallia sp. API 0066 TaxID=2896846 RepID=UPI001E3EA711|nr:PrsW family intramembrane metalloprotease [Actinocorallia sp. API 0066]MCD0453704.1 PrsW family intramembrane metalloprotease [Actinocorallia sp. API 0066]